MPPFKDEHVLIMAPGSQTTLAQLGLPESYTPARLRMKTRMFPADKAGEWEPVKVRERKGKNGEAQTPRDEDDEDEDEAIYEEDMASEEDAVYPLEDGRVTNWSCFFALLTHVYNTLSPPFHTPILLIVQPSWTQHDHETLTQFFFEKFKTPAFALMDHALATIYAYSVSTATVVDIGYGKCDITAVNDFTVSDIGRGIAIPDCGGERMTQRLYNLLSNKGFTKDLSEDLKRSAICEILPPGAILPAEVQSATGVNPAALASTGLNGSGPGLRNPGGPHGLPRGPGVGTEVGGDGDPEENEGVLDVASIVTSGKTSEFLAKKEREKAEKAAAKKSANEASAAAKIARLPNSQRAKAVFYYDERRPAEELEASMRQENGDEDSEEARDQDGAPLAPPAEEADPVLARKEERRRNRDRAEFVRKEIEVGVERFRAADNGMLEHIADAIHRCILSVPEINKRSELWDSLIVVGNGSRVRGFKDALLATLNAKYIISPSSATIFTSELPSNFSTPVATPLATGANTPQPQPQPTHHGSGVNPLLLAATTSANHALGPPNHQLPQTPGQPQQSLSQFQSQTPGQQYTGQPPLLLQQSHSGHGQSPTSIKLARMAEYFPEWKEVGFEEAHFLGAQVAAKIVFIVDQGLSKGFMSRSEYNELGPQGIHEFAI